MSRKISIIKSGESTLVKQWNKEDESDTITKVYNIPVNYTKDRYGLIIDKTGYHQRLAIQHSEIVIPITANIDELVTTLTTGNFFQ